MQGEGLRKGAAAFLLAQLGRAGLLRRAVAQSALWCDDDGSRLSRRVWAARKGFCPMPKMTAEQEELVTLLLDPVVCAPNAP